MVVRAGAAAQVFVDDPAAPSVGEHDRHHLLRVLRLTAGERVIASDGCGRWVLCYVRSGSPVDLPEKGRPRDRPRGDFLLEPDGPVMVEDAPALPLTVAFAPTKGDRPEWVVQKLTEIGIDRIVPLVADRSVVHWDGERLERAMDRLKRAAVEASAQCRRVWIPEVTEPQTLQSVLAVADAAGERVGQAHLGGCPPEGGVTSVVVGPEGGWSPAELGLGCPRIGLGPNVLRAETAAVVAGAMLGALRTGTVVPSKTRPS
ncbi:MAG: RsmE family RNA methyltransferase [Acidimicrobiales bacterium]